MRIQLVGADGKEHIVEFDGTPTEADIDEVAASFKPKSSSVFTEPYRSNKGALSGIAGVVAGGVKAGAKTVGVRSQKQIDDERAARGLRVQGRKPRAPHKDLVRADMAQEAYADLNDPQRLKQFHKGATFVKGPQAGLVEAAQGIEKVADTVAEGAGEVGEWVMSQARKVLPVPIYPGSARRHVRDATKTVLDIPVDASKAVLTGDPGAISRTALNVAVPVVASKAIQGAKEVIRRMSQLGDNAVLPMAEKYRPAGSQVKAPGQKQIATAPKVKEPVATGLARRFEDTERKAAGKVLTPASPHTPKALAAKGQKAVESGEVDPKEVIKRVVDEGKSPSFDTDIPAVNFYKAQVKNDKAKLLKQPPSPERDMQVALLDRETDRISQFSAKAQEQFHGTGMALQGAHDVDSMLFVDLRDQARALNLGEKLDPKIEKQLQELAEKHSATMVELDTVKAQLAQALKGKSIAPSRVRSRASALDQLRRLGIQTVESPPVGGMGSKQAGAVSIPGGTTTGQLVEAVRGLANHYVRQGVTDIEELLTKLVADVPGMSKDDFLAALSPTARKMRTEAMVQSIQARRVMNKIRQQAEFRTKSAVDKVLTTGLDVIKNVPKNIMSSMDASVAFMQGKPALLARPGSWLKSWKDAARAAAASPKGTSASQDKIFADLMQDPVIREGVDQGWLSLRTPHGAFSANEEVFKGNMADWLPGVARSNNMFSSQANLMYGDWYRKLVAFMPDNEQYKQSIGAMINIFSGRGHGKIADALGGEPWGWLGYAPKYAYSIAQLGTAAPVWMRGMHPAARLQAAKAYAGMLTSIYVITKAAPLFGWEVDTDPRSINFGMAKSSKTGRMVDAYNKVTQFPRLIWQMFYGKEGGRGQFKAPGDFGFEPLLDYVHNNFSPALRDLEMISTGKTWDSQKGKFVDVDTKRFLMAHAPLGVQDIARMKDKDAPNLISSFVGMRPKQAEPRRLNPGEKRKPKWKVMPPGLKRMFD